MGRTGSGSALESPSRDLTERRIAPFYAPWGWMMLLDPDNELSEPVPITDVAVTLNQLDGYEWNETDLDDIQQQWQWDGSIQLIGQFLIDQGGIVRWVNIECAKEGAAGMGKFPTEAELLAAARVLST